jgi:hypothetical protein
LAGLFKNSTVQERPRNPNERGIDNDRGKAPADSRASVAFPFRTDPCLREAHQIPRGRMRPRRGPWRSRKGRTAPWTACWQSCLVVLLVCRCQAHRGVKALVPEQQQQTRSPSKPTWPLSSTATVNRRPVLLQFLSSLSFVGAVRPAGARTGRSGEEPDIPASRGAMPLTQLLQPATSDRPQIPLPTSAPGSQQSRIRDPTVIAEGSESYPLACMG